MTYLVSAPALLVIGGLHLWWKKRYYRLDEARARTESQRQAQQQSLFDSMAEGVLILDSSDRIQLINQSLEKLFGLTTDVRGQTVLEAFRLELLANIVNDLRAEKTMHGSELELPRLDERWLQVNASAIIDKQGVRQGSILVFHDLTRLKQLENPRRELVANASHELRTPLSLIKGFV